MDEPTAHTPKSPTHKLDENPVEREKSEYRTIIQTSLDGFLISDFSGRILDVNEALCLMLGYTREELLRMSIPDIEAAEAPEETAAHIQKIIRTGSDRFQTRHRHKDGTIIDIDVSAQYVAELGERFFAFLRDISERKRAESELMLFGEIERSMSEAFYLIRVSDGVIVRSSPVFDRMFGYEPGELLGKHVSIVNAPGDENAEAVAGEIIGSLIRTGGWSGEVHNIRKDGTTFWCHAVVLTLEHPQYGRVWLSVHRDITERKQAEQAIRQLNAELEQRVVKRPARWGSSSCHTCCTRAFMSSVVRCNSKRPAREKARISSISCPIFWALSLTTLNRRLPSSSSLGA